MSAHQYLTIQTEGDLEVVVLLETHSLLARIIGSDFYTVGGTTPDQNVVFKDRVSFDFFIVLAHELIAPTSKGIGIAALPSKISLLTGLELFAARYPAEATHSGLSERLAKLNAWLDSAEDVPFAPPEAGKHISLKLSHREMLNVTANAMKHHLLRLSDQLKKLSGWCAKAGYIYSPHQLMDVNRALTEELHNGLEYYQTWLTELLGGLFFSINRIVMARFAENPTNDVSKMKFPSGVTSDVIQDLYGDLLVFHRYTDERITKYTPTTAWFFKKPYWTK